MSTVTNSTPLFHVYVDPSDSLEKPVVSPVLASVHREDQFGESAVSIADHLVRKSDPVPVIIIEGERPREAQEGVNPVEPEPRHSPREVVAGSAASANNPTLVRVKGDGNPRLQELVAEACRENDKAPWLDGEVGKKA